MKRLYNMDIILIISLTILCLLFVFIPSLNETPVIAILGLILIFFSPGYSLISSLFLKKNDLTGIKRIGLSFGMSVAISPLLGFLSNYASFGIKVEPVVLSLSLFTLLMCTIAYLRRRSIPEEDRFNVNFMYYIRNLAKVFNKESKIDNLLLSVIVISAILITSMTAYALVYPPQGEKFTEFYILGSNGKTSNYPTNLTIGENKSIIIGISNHEYTKTDYRLIIQLNGNMIKEENITLSNNEKWEKSFPFVVSRAFEKQKLEFLLYKLPDNTNVYRSLLLWVNAK